MISPLSLKLKYLSQVKKTVEHHFKSNNNKLFLDKAKGRSSMGDIVHLPFKTVNKQELIAFFKEKQINNKNVIINADSSHLLGIKRWVHKEHMLANIYKGQSQTVDFLSKYNPSTPLSHQQLLFDQTLFAITDELFKDLMSQSDELDDRIIEYYNAHPERGAQRLLNQYKLPLQIVNVIETAHNFDNEIYFAGINEYQLRNILSSYFSLPQLKVFFYECLQHSFLHNPTDIAAFSNNSRSKLWEDHFQLLQPIAHRKIQNLRKKVKGISFARNFDFEVPENEKKISEVAKDKEVDSIKLEKHAMLQVLFGKLWSQPYTNNPFPYLTEQFLKMQKDDQKLVSSIFNNWHSKYSQAVDKYYELAHNSSLGKKDND